MKKSRMTIKGLRETIELTQEEGLAVERLLADKTVSPETGFSIEGIWSGKKSDIRYVVWDRDDEKRFEKKVFLKEELDLVESELNLISSHNPDSTVSLELLWLQSKGIIRIDSENQVVIRQPNLFADMTDKYNATINRKNETN